MHPLSDALPLPYVPPRVTRGTSVAHRHSFAPPHCRTSQYRRSFVPSLCLFGTVLVTLCLMVWDWRVSRGEPMLSCWHDLLFFLSPTVLSFLPSMGWCIWTDRVFSLSPGLAQRTPNNNNNNNNNNHVIDIIFFCAN